MDFVSRTPGIPAGSVREAISTNRYQPWHERPLRIVCSTNRMHGEQDVLNEIFDIFRPKKSTLSANNLSYPRRNLLEKPRVCEGVARLGSPHEFGKTVIRRLPQDSSSVRSKVPGMRGPTSSDGALRDELVPEFSWWISCNAICAGAMRIIAVNPALLALNLTHVAYFDYAQ